MKIAVVGADAGQRRDHAELLAKERGGLLILAGSVGVEAEGRVVFGGSDGKSFFFSDWCYIDHGSLLKKRMEDRIGQQIQLSKGFISDGCTLDFLVAARLSAELCRGGRYDFSAASMRMHARLHAWRVLDEIIYVPVKEDSGPIVKQYDAFLLEELSLISSRVPVVAAGGKEPFFRHLKREVGYV